MEALACACVRLRVHPTGYFEGFQTEGLRHTLVNMLSTLPLVAVVGPDIAAAERVDECASRASSVCCVCACRLSRACAAAAVHMLCTLGNALR